MTTSATQDTSDPPVKKPLYEASTQFTNWRYSLEQLADIRKSFNDAAVAAIRNTFETAEVIYIQCLSP
jgi:cyclin H